MPANAASIAGHHSSTRLLCIDVALILVVFFVHAGWPTPDVNEAHYLSKAKHYWNPQWCAGDQFLESADAHLVFYWTCGWWSQWLSLPALAWVGRIITWLMLAYTWQRLSFEIVPRPLFAVLSAALFVAASQWTNLAGEWVVGGFEAKGLAYVAVFAALRAWSCGAWNRAWVCLGIATAFHALAGGWTAIGLAVVWLADRNRPALSAMFPGLLIGALVATVGVWPAVALNADTPSDVVDLANVIYVFERLPHHLAPFSKPASEWGPRVLRHGLLLLALYFLARVAHRIDGAADGRAKLRPLHYLAGVGIALAIAGGVIELWLAPQPPLAARWLRYYWFRLTDVALPLAAATTAGFVLSRCMEQQRRSSLPVLCSLLLLVAAHIVTVTWLRWHLPSTRAEARLADPDAWIDVCSFVVERTPRQAMFIIPRAASTFQWRCDRPAVVCYKNIPQDAQGIVDWRQRLFDVYGQRPRGLAATTRTAAGERAEVIAARLQNARDKYRA